MNKTVYVQAHSKKVSFFSAKSSIERLQIDEDRFVDDTQCVIDAYNNDGYNQRKNSVEDFIFIPYPQYANW